MEATTRLGYLRGTRILGDKAEIEIERLRTGDRVRTLDGSLQVIARIGWGAYLGRLAAAGERPIRIRAGALGEGIPKRELYVAPAQSLFIDGLRIAARDLVNGISIISTRDVERIEYFHLEFESHAVIFAEGAPCESVVDEALYAGVDLAAIRARLARRAEQRMVRFVSAAAATAANRVPESR